MNFGKPINITVHFGAVQSSGGGAAITIDSALSSTSTNPVQNKVITGAIDELKTKVVNQTAPEVTIQPNVMNVWGDSVSILTIKKGTEIAGIVNNYMIRFTVSGEGTPDIRFDWDEEEIQWYGGNEIEFVNGNTYEISIVNNIALWAEFEPKAE
jgi:hypothetical protein